MRQVVIYPGEDGFWVAECPSLPGCISQGKTKEEAVANIKEAIRGYVAALEEDHLPIPAGARVATSFCVGTSLSARLPYPTTKNWTEEPCERSSGPQDSVSTSLLNCSEEKPRAAEEWNLDPWEGSSFRGRWTCAAGTALTGRTQSGSVSQAGSSIALSLTRRPAIPGGHALQGTS